MDGPDSTARVLAEAREALATNPELVPAMLEPLLGSEDFVLRTRATVLAAVVAYEQGDHEQARELAAVAELGLHDLGDTSDAFDLHVLYGRLHLGSAELSLAATSFAEAAQVGRSLGDASRELEAINLQASAVNGMGQHQRALGILTRAMSTAVGAQEHGRLASMRSNIGKLQHLLGNYPEAMENLMAAQEHFDALPTATRAKAVNLMNLGRLYHDMGRPAEARRLFMQAQQAGLEIGDAKLVAVVLNNLANTDMASGDHAVALERFREALVQAQTICATEFVIDNLDGMGQAYDALGQHEQAVRVHLEALEASRSIGNRIGELDALVNLGRASLHIGEPAHAAAHLEQALTAARALEHRTRIFEIHQLLSQAYEAAGDPWQALHHARRFHEAESAVFNEANEERMRELLVKFELAQSQHAAETYRLRSELMKEAMEEAEARVRSRTVELEEAHLDMVTRLAVAAEFRDDGTGEHTRRVGRNAAATAYVMGFSREDVAVLFAAAKLHDVGKIGMPDSILHKRGRLTPDELELMREHTMIGARILAGGRSRLLKVAESISLSHHERYDGKGYPDGLSGEQIPMAARIVAVSDVLDALVHTRPYKAAWPVSEALAEIESLAGTQFDPAVVAATMLIFRGRDALSPLDFVTDWRDMEQVLERLGGRRINGGLERTAEW